MRRCSSVAEQRFRKPQVKGSNPLTGSRNNFRHWQAPIVFRSSRLTYCLNIKPLPR